MMHHTPIILIVYGLIVLIGGLFGYLKAKSLPSLISGVVSAVIVFLSAVLFAHHPRLSLIFGAEVGLILAIVMIIRYRSTKKPIPALPVAAISLLNLVYCLYDLFFGIHAGKA